MVGSVGEPGVPVEEPALDIHSHHWMIAKQDGPSSEGMCKACGEVRKFTNGFRRSYPSTYRAPLPRPAPGP